MVVFSFQNYLKVIDSSYKMILDLWDCFEREKLISANFHKTDPVVTFAFMLISAKHEISDALKYKNIKKFSIFQAQMSLECYFSCSQMLKCQQLLAF